MSLNDYKINTFSKPVSALADRPRITAAELKAWFDSNTTNEIKSSINSLIDALVALTGADQIGASVEGIAQQTVFGVLTALKVLIDDRYTIAQTDSRLLLKFDDANAQDLVKTVNIDRQTGVFTVTKYDGTVETWDTAIEKVAIDAKLDGTDFVLTLVDGTEQRVSLSAFVDTYNFVTSDTIQVIETVGDSSKSYTFNIRPGSIKTEMMDPQLLTTITGYVESASASAARAARSAESALTSKTDAVTSAAAALASAQNAGQSESNARLYKNAAEESAKNAEASAVNAAESEKSALASKNAAASSATAALSSETAANTAKASAESSQTAAAVSAAEAAISAASALESKTAAETSAANASASEAKAKASETAASTSQISASASADRAEEAAKRAENIAGLEVVVKSDIVNDLTAGGVEKVLSAEQGKNLQLNKMNKAKLIDNDGTALETNLNVSVEIVDEYLDYRHCGENVISYLRSGLIMVDPETSFEINSSGEITAYIGPANPGWATIPSIVNNTIVKRIGNDVYNADISTAGNVQMVMLPNTITEIGSNAFKNCEVLFPLPPSIKRIENYAFYGNRAETEVIQHLKNLEYIGNYAFANNKFGTLIISDSVRHIGDYAFSNCYLNLVIWENPSSEMVVGLDIFSHPMQTAIKYPFLIKTRKVSVLKTLLKDKLPNDDEYKKAVIVPYDSTYIYFYIDSETFMAASLITFADYVDSAFNGYLNGSIIEIVGNDVKIGNYFVAKGATKVTKSTIIESDYQYSLIS